MPLKWRSSINDVEAFAIAESLRFPSEDHAGPIFWKAYMPVRASAATACESASDLDPHRGVRKSLNDEDYFGVWWLDAR